MNKNADYLLRYVSMETYNKILREKNNYVLELINDNYVDINLNIKFLIKYGVSNIEKVITSMLEELAIPHDEFVNKILEYEKNLPKSEVIMLLENL